MTAKNNLNGRKVAVFDMDDTLSDTTQRRHHLDVPKGEKKNWAAFYAACGADADQPHFVEMALSLSAAGVEIVVFSGRLESCRDDTASWLWARGIEPALMRFRPEKSFMKSHQLKGMWLDWLVKSGAEVVMAIDDEEANIKMFSEAGLLTLDAKDVDSTKLKFEELMGKIKKQDSSPQI